VIYLVIFVVKAVGVIANITQHDTQEELFAAYKLALEAANNETVWKKKVIERKDIKKAQLGIK